MEPYCRVSMLQLTGAYCSFEVQLFQIILVNPVVFVIVYHPPQPNKDFLNEFVREIVTIYDRISILGDFNIHLYCDSKPLSEEFLSLINSLDFVQLASGPTHSLWIWFYLMVSVLDFEIN